MAEHAHPRGFVSMLYKSTLYKPGVDQQKQSYMAHASEVPMATSSIKLCHSCKS